MGLTDMGLRLRIRTLHLRRRGPEDDSEVAQGVLGTPGHRRLGVGDTG